MGRAVSEASLLEKFPVVFFGGDTSHQGALPPGPPFCPPPWAEGLPEFWAPPVAGLLMRATRSLFWFCGGTPPTTPRRGGSAPLDPPFCPPPLAEGSPAFWVPLVAGLLMEATRSLFWFCGGTPPTTPRHGGFAPLDPPFCPPPWAEGLPEFWAPLVVGVLMGATRPLFWFCGGTPPTTPRHGGFACSGPPLPDLTASIKAIKI